MTIYTKTCLYCKKLFTANRSNHYYCTPSCRTLANRKGYNDYEYPNQLEIGLKRNIVSLARRLLEYEEKGISIKNIIELRRECSVIHAFTVNLVNPDNIFYKCFTEAIEPLVNEIDLPDIDHQYIFFKINPDMNQSKFDYKTLDSLFLITIPHNYYNRLRAIDER